MAEEPYDDLDIGYIEYPMPNTEEFTVVRLLTKTGLAQLWQKIKDKFIRKPDGGSEGQALVKTSSGVSWDSFFKAPEGGSEGQAIIKTSDGYSWDSFFKAPEGGSEGQAIIKTESGVAWGDVETDIPPATDANYGTVKYMPNSDFCQEIDQSYNPSDWSNLENQSTPVTIAQLKFILNDLYTIYPPIIKLEYIESDRAKQCYLDTGYYPTSNTCIEAKFKFNLATSSGASSCAFGTDDGWNVNDFGVWSHIIAYGNKSTSYSFDTNVHEIKFNKNQVYIDNSLQHTFNSQTFTCAHSLYVGGLNRNGEVIEFASVRIYSLKILENDVVMRDFIPAINTLTGVVGLYDRQNSAMYGNSSDSFFVAGPKIN